MPHSACFLLVLLLLIGSVMHLPNVCGAKRKSSSIGKRVSSLLGGGTDRRDSYPPARSSDGRRAAKRTGHGIVTQLKIGDRVEFAGDEDFFRKANCPQINIKHGDTATIVGGQPDSWRVKWDNEEWSVWNERVEWEDCDFLVKREDIDLGKPCSAGGGAPTKEDSEPEDHPRSQPGRELKQGSAESRAESQALRRSSEDVSQSEATGLAELKQTYRSAKQQLRALFKNPLGQATDDARAKKTLAAEIQQMLQQITEQSPKFLEEEAAREESRKARLEEVVRGALPRERNFLRERILQNTSDEEALDTHAVGDLAHGGRRFVSPSEVGVAVEVRTMEGGAVDRVVVFTRDTMATVRAWYDELLQKRGGAGLVVDFFKQGTRNALRDAAMVGELAEMDGAKSLMDSEKSLKLSLFALPQRRGVAYSAFVNGHTLEKVRKLPGREFNDSDEIFVQNGLHFEEKAVTNGMQLAKTADTRHIKTGQFHDAMGNELTHTSHRGWCYKHQYEEGLRQLEEAEKALAKAAATEEAEAETETSESSPVVAPAEPVVAGAVGAPAAGAGAAGAPAAGGGARRRRFSFQRFFGSSKK